MKHLELKRFSLLFFLLLPVTSSGESLFIVKTHLSYIPEVVRISDLVIKDSEFLNEIEEISSFEDTSHNGLEVVNSIRLGGFAYLGSYRSKKPWSNVTAYTSGDYIRFNTRNNPRSVTSMVNTLIHEWLHVIGYHHVKANPKSVPYTVGKISEKYVYKYILF